MTVKIELSAEIEAALREHWKDLPRAVLEAVAIEGYREGVLSHKQVGDLLGASSRWEVENFLAEHKPNVHPIQNFTGTDRPAGTTIPASTPAAQTADRR
jgi:hypothetical protein